MAALVTPTSSGPAAGTQLAEAFDPAPGFLDAATMGLPPRRTTAALRAAIEEWASGRASAVEYDAVVTQARALYARIVGVGADDVAVGAQTSVTAGMVAASLPDGANVLCVDGDFTSMVFPFLAQAERGVTVRHVPLEQLAESVDETTDLVAFSIAQSADGRLADGRAVAEAARLHGAMTFADVTQAAGWLPVQAGDYDITVCSTYKWLCCPRGLAFTTVTADARARLRPVYAGWYAGESIWDSCYGPDMHLAVDARRFDVAPVWLAFVGAVPSLELILSLSAHERRQGSRLADALRERLDLAPEGRPVVSLEDPDGRRRSRLADAGCTVAARAGRVRIAFHLWNTEHDVDLAAGALTR